MLNQGLIHGSILSEGKFLRLHRALRVRRVGGLMAGCEVMDAGCHRDDLLSRGGGAGAVR